MWHASVAGRFGGPQWRLLEEITAHELYGVGDAAAGEWRERGDIAFHLRRRLTEKEMRAAAIEAVCDIRGTAEQRTRIERMRPFLPLQFQGVPYEGLP